MKRRAKASAKHKTIVKRGARQRRIICEVCEAAEILREMRKKEKETT